MPLLPSERRTRLSQLATQWDLRNARVVKPIDRRLAATVKNPTDVDVARGHIETVRLARVESKHRKGVSKIFTSKPKPTSYKQREIHTALLSVLQNHGTPGVVEVLLEHMLQHNRNIDIIPKSTKKWKQIANVNQEDIRTGLLSAATRTGNINTIRLLVPYSDEASLNESLSIALKAIPRNLDIVELLLAYGADASVQENTFLSLVSHSDRDLVGLLLTAPRPVSVKAMTDGLYAAVTAGSLDMVFLLAKTNADGDHNNGQILARAVVMARPELVTTLTLCNCPPSQTSLNEAVPMIFYDSSTSNSRKRQLLDTLLDGGATAANAAVIFLDITKLCIADEPALDEHLVNILGKLIRANAPLDYDHSAAWRQTVSSSRTDLIDLFLTSKNFDSRLASLGFSIINSNTSPEIRVSITSKLLARGASGLPLQKALVHAVKTDHLELVNVLLKGNGVNKASVDSLDAAALKDAISREKIQLVRILLASGPSPESVSSAFINIWQCQKEGRLVLAQDLLNAGAEGDNVIRSLVTALKDQGPNKDQGLIRVLIRGGAELGFENGIVFKLATQSFDMISLDMLLEVRPSPQYLIAAFTAAMGLRPNSNRFTACEKL